MSDDLIANGIIGVERHLATCDKMFNKASDFHYQLASYSL